MNSEKIFTIFWCIFMICIFGAMLSIPLYTSRNKLIKEDKEYLYYKEYKIWNLDSCIYKYHKPITHNGIVTKKETSSHTENNNNNININNINSLSFQKDSLLSPNNKDQNNDNNNDNDNDSSSSKTISEEDDDGKKTQKQLHLSPN